MQTNITNHLSDIYITANAAAESKRINREDRHNFRKYLKTLNHASVCMIFCFVCMKFDIIDLNRLYHFWYKDATFQHGPIACPCFDFFLSQANEYLK